MANPPPPYDNITGISRAVMKDNAQETLGNYNGNARPGELVVDLTQDPPPLYVGNNAGQLTLVASGGGAGLPLANGTSNFNIATVNGNATITTASANTWTFSTTGNLTLPGNTSQINYANGNSVLAAYATISSVYTSNVTTQSINNPDSGGTYNNSSTLDITYTAYNGASTLDFDIAYQAPLTANIGISVGAVSTPLIQSNANIQIQANTGTAQTWTFVTTGNLELPSEGNIVGITANNNGHMQWVGNSSGDGAGYTTLRLVPDDTLVGNDQYLIIDPTAPGHIHIRAGGTQDASSADLFLGGENSYFKVNAGANNEVRISANSHAWVFGADSVLTVPGEGLIRSIGDVVTLQSYNVGTGNVQSVYLGSGGGLGFFDQDIGGNWLEIFKSGAEPQIRVPVGRGNLNVQTAEGINAYDWVFDNTGKLTMPGPAQLAVYANTTVRDSSITSPTPGMMIYVTGTGMQVRGATSWNTIAGTGT